MKVKIVSLFATLLFFSILKTHLADEVCNEFVDEALRDIKSDKEYFEEPYEMPKNQNSFGIYELEHGSIFGLTSLHRYGDVTILKKSKSTYMKVYLAAGEINIKSKIKRKFLSFGKSANVDVTIPLLEMTFDVVPKPNGFEPSIKDFKITEVKGLSVKVKGAGFIRDLLMNSFIKLAGKFFENALKNTIEGKLKSFFKNKILEYTIPSECLNNGWE